MKFFAIVAQAFLESRQRQADRIIRDHLGLMGRVGMADDTTNVVELAKPCVAGAVMRADFKAAA